VSSFSIIWVEGQDRTRFDLCPFFP